MPVRKFFFRRKRLCFYISPKQVEDLGWKSGETLLMEKKGREILIYKPDAQITPIHLSKNGNGQFYITMPVTPPKENRGMVFWKRVRDSIIVRFL